VVGNERWAIHIDVRGYGSSWGGSWLWALGKVETKRGRGSCGRVGGGLSNVKRGLVSLEKETKRCGENYFSGKNN